MSRLTDAELIRRFRAGDDSALEALFERHEQAVYHFLVGLLRNPHLAEDVLQDTFVKALERVSEVQAERFKGWLYTVAYREAMLARRRGKLAPSSGAAVEEPASREPDPCTLAGQADEAHLLRQLISQLPEAQQRVIHARIYEGKPFHEIAAALGCPLNTALARMHQGLHRLRQWLEARHG